MLADGGRVTVEVVQEKNQLKRTEEDRYAPIDNPTFTGTVTMPEAAIAGYTLTTRDDMLCVDKDKVPVLAVEPA